MRHHNRTRIVCSLQIIAILLFMSIASVSVSAQETCTPSGEVKRGGELRFGRWEEPLTFDPQIPGDNGSIYLIVQVFDTLVRPDATGTGLEPGLAESWDISEDGLIYTFHLRDAQFSNGDPVTAEDVVFSLERAREDGRGYAFLFEPFSTIEATDDQTVEITLNRPFSPMLSTVSVFAASIVPKAVVEADPDNFGDNPIGSGPFMVEEYARGDRVVLVPNPNYWELGADCEPLPYLDKITVQYMPESNSRVLGFRNGDFDVMAIVPYNEATNLQQMDGVTVEVAPLYRLDYVYLNHQAAPLDKREFRLALNYAADRQAILDLVFFGFGELPNSFMPKMNFHSPDVPLIPHDPDRARELLAEAGYNGEPISILIPAGDAPSAQIATILQQSWTEVGINAQLQEMDGSSIFGEVAQGNYQALVSYITSDINDDDELATLQADGSAQSGFNSFFSWYNNPEVNDLLAQARLTGDAAERAELYAQVQDIVYNDGYSVPLNFSPYVNAYYNYVVGWKNIATGWWWLRSVWLDQ
jgi:peptide/nickel transport system substrate-binding protein